MIVRSHYYVLLLFFMLAFQPFNALAQLDYQWGFIPPADLHLEQYPPDTSAVAAILIDDGKATVFSSSDDYGHILSHYRRVKVFKKAGFSWADVSIPYYIYENTEDILSIQARITLPNGLHFELDKGDFLRERIDERWSALKFAFPKVEGGRAGIQLPPGLELYDRTQTLVFPVEHSGSKTTTPCANGRR